MSSSIEIKEETESCRLSLEAKGERKPSEYKV
jgi:hypothetical protein